MPVAARPAVQARAGHVGLAGLRFNQCHVAHHGAAHQCAFQQVVAKHLFRWQAAIQHGVQRSHVDEAFACEAAFAKQVLVHIRRHGAVRVHAVLACHQPVVGRGTGCVGGSVGQRRSDAWLQDAVAGHHVAARGVQHGLILRVGGHGHQRAQLARGQVGVAVQCQQVASAGCQAGGGAQVQEWAGLVRGQGGHQLLQFAALAFPAHPGLLGGTVLACPVQQQKTGRAIGRCRMVAVQVLDAFAGGGQAVVVAIGLSSRGVGPVGQQCKLGIGLVAGQVVQQQAVQQLACGGIVAQHGGYHHQHPFIGWNAMVQRKPGQVHGPDRLADEPVEQRHHGLGGGQAQCQGGQHAQAHGRPRPPCRPHRAAMPDQPGHPRACGPQQCQQIDRHARQPPQCTPRAGGAALHAQLLLESGPARPTEPMPGQRLGATGLGHLCQQLMGYPGFTPAGLVRQPFNGMQGLVAGHIVFGHEHGRGEHDAHHQAAAGHDV